jgi:MoxR-like ATPase
MPDYKSTIEHVLLKDPNAARDDIIRALKKDFPEKSDATLGERLSNFAITEDSTTGKHYVMRPIPRDEMQGAGTPRTPRSTASTPTSPTSGASVGAPAATPVPTVSKARAAAATGEANAIDYEGPDPRLQGTRWFRRLLDAESGDAMQSASSEPWEVIFPDGGRWQFEIPTSKARDGYRERIVGASDDVTIVQNLLEVYRPALFIGHTGVGKTSVVAAAAGDPKWQRNQEAGNTPWIRPRIYRAVMSNMSYEQLIGQFVPDTRAGQPRPDGKGTYGSFKWQDGVLTRMVNFGGIFIADEINFTSPDVLVAINSLLDRDRFIIIPQDEGRIVHAHRDFRLLAAMNPIGYGYVGTKPLNAALKSRFASILWYDWSPETEKKDFRPSAVVPNATSTAGTELKMDSIHAMLKDLRDGFRLGTFHYPPGRRDLENFVDNCRAVGIQQAVISFLLLYDDARERGIVLLRIQNHIPKEFIPALSEPDAAQYFS